MTTPTTNKYDFTDKVALVTGSGGPATGASIAINLAFFGARLALTDRDASGLALVSAEIERFSGVKPLVVIGDLEDRNFTQKLLQDVLSFYGKLDILVNNAAQWSGDGNLGNPQLIELFDKLMNINVRPAVQLTQLAIPALERSKGVVINISSQAAFMPRNLGYCTSKAALDMATKCMALELAPRGIRVNSVNPGRILRGWGQPLSEADVEYNKRTVEKFASLHALGRCATAQEIANAVLFLASGDASFVTGTIMLDDGGRMLK